MHMDIANAEPARPPLLKPVLPFHSAVLANAKGPTTVHSNHNGSQPNGTPHHPAAVSPPPPPPPADAAQPQSSQEHNLAAAFDESLLLQELPFVSEGQISLGDLVDRVVQAIYAELSELADTLPNMSDAARKRTLADWVVKTKKQIVKLYAVAKWSRDAEIVQKSMNIVAFIMSQNHQFISAIQAIDANRDNLDHARMRNHDILTSLDVLTTGTYQRLPTIIKKLIIPQTPLTDAQVIQTLSSIQDAMRYRLRLHELVPIEMSDYTIADGRAHFTAPNLFRASLCLKGSDNSDGWFLVDVEFLFEIGGEGIEDFPRIPTGILKRYIVDEADTRLGLFVPSPPQPELPQDQPIPERPKLPENVVDAPLVRLFNFLQTMSLSYQLEVLFAQAARMRSLGWAKHLSAKMSPDRQSFLTTYWIRPPPPSTTKPSPHPPLPPFAGTLKISIVPAAESITPKILTPSSSSSSSSKPPVPTKASPSSSIHAAYRAQMSPRSRVLSELQHQSKLGTSSPSDQVEKLCFRVEWEPSNGAFGIPTIPPKLLLFEDEAAVLAVNSNDLDFEKLLRTILDKHIKVVLLGLQQQFYQFPYPHVFTRPGVVKFVSDANSHALHVRISPTEVVVITIDPRTGRLILRDIGDLVATTRGPRFASISDKLNDVPNMLANFLFTMRQNAILELVEQKAMYLGLQSYRRRNLSREEMAKFGANVRNFLFITLSMFENHYLVVLVEDEQFRFALISCDVQPDALYQNLVVKDIASLDFERIRGDQDVVVKKEEGGNNDNLQIGMKRKRPLADENGDIDPFAKFVLETSELKELYNYCCARVAYMKVETQLKEYSILFSYVTPATLQSLTPELAHVQSSLARSVPSLCVASRQLLAGAPASEAAMPNVRIIPLNWWSDKRLQILTCIKLKYVQKPMGKAAAGSEHAVIRPSQRIIYDTREAVVSFLCDDVNSLVKEIQDEWARVSQMVVIAREVARMKEQTDRSDVRLLSFDLQTVEFAYSGDYTVTVAYENPDDFTSSRFHLRFSKRKKSPSSSVDSTTARCMDMPPPSLLPPPTTGKPCESRNPHSDSERFMRNILIRGHGRLASSVHRLVSVLRDTLPVLEELESVIDAWNSQPGRLLRSIIELVPKAAGWYRMVYGDSRHALDLRLMSEGRIAFVDASHSLYLPTFGNGGGGSSMVGISPANEVSSGNLRAIPNMGELANTVTRELLSTSQVKRRTIMSLNVGIICSAESAPTVLRTLHPAVVHRIGLSS